MNTVIKKNRSETLCNIPLIRKNVILLLIAFLPLVAVAQSAGGQIKRPVQKHQSSTKSTKKDSKSEGVVNNRNKERRTDRPKSHNSGINETSVNTQQRVLNNIVPANTKQESIGVRQHSADSIVNTVNRQHVIDSFVNADYAIFDNVSYFNEDYAAVEVNKKWGFIDKSGNMVIPCQYYYTRGFSEGLASVILNGEIGFIDKKGRVVIPFSSYDLTEDFKEGLALVMINDKYGVIDKTGKMVVPCKFDFVFSDFFHEGLAVVEIKEKYGFINKTGRKVIPSKYDSAGDFKEGLARVELKGKYGFIDKRGRV